MIVRRRHVSARPSPRAEPRPPDPEPDGRPAPVIETTALTKRYPGPVTALDALTVTVAEMAAALARVAGPQASALIDWVPDPVVARIVTSWPARIRADRAAALGLAPDPDFDSIIRLHIAESS